MAGSQTETLSTADLIRRASDQVQLLVRDEIALARAELTGKAKSAAMGAGLLGGAGALAFYGTGALITGCVLLVALVLPGWAAALVVGGALLVIAGLVALIGVRRVRGATPPVPEQAIAGVRADLETVSHAVEERGHR
jgi:membrane protein implicated in regulation of membrane protease activity